MLETWWQQRNLREKYLLIAASFFITIFILYTLIWAPLSAYVVQARNDVLLKESLVVDMHSALREHMMPQLAATDIEADASDSTLVAVTQTFTKAGLSKYITSTNNPSMDHIVLTFQGVPFDAWIKSVETLWLAHDMIVSEVDIKRGHDVGLVDTTLTLQK